MSKKTSRTREYKTWVDVRDAELEQVKTRNKKPLTNGHKVYIQAIEDHAITIVAGPAGSAKTSLAVEVAVKLLKQGKIQRIVLVRPLVECDEETGFLPGDLREKMAPFVAPLTQWLATHYSPRELEGMWAQGIIEVVPLATMRGLDFQDCVVIIDEAQGATYRQLKMALTRVGENCRMIICGDLKQSDIVSRVAAVPLLRIIRQLGKQPRLKEVSLVVLTDADVLRSDLVKELDKRLVG